MYVLIARKKASHTMSDGTKICRAACANLRGPNNYYQLRRFSPSGSPGILRFRRPKEHLVPVLVQNPQAIGVLRHIQSVEERLGLDLCALQIRRDVRNAIEHGARIVLFANAEELYRKHHFCVSLATKCKAPNKLAELARRRP